jgi:hypothetical protein
VLPASQEIPHLFRKAHSDRLATSHVSKSRYRRKPAVCPSPKKCVGLQKPRLEICNRYPNPVRGGWLNCSRDKWRTGVIGPHRHQPTRHETASHVRGRRPVFSNMKWSWFCPGEPSPGIITQMAMVPLALSWRSVRAKWSETQTAANVATAPTACAIAPNATHQSAWSLTKHFPVYLSLIFTLSVPM